MVFSWIDCILLDEIDFLAEAEGRCPSVERIGEVVELIRRSSASHGVLLLLLLEPFPLAEAVGLFGLGPIQRTVHIFKGRLISLSHAANRLRFILRE